MWARILDSSTLTSFKIKNLRTTFCTLRLIKNVVIFFKEQHNSWGLQYFEVTGYEKVCAKLHPIRDQKHWFPRFPALFYWLKQTPFLMWLAELTTLLFVIRPSIAVITVEPAEKISFVYNCMQTRLRGQYNGKWPISLVCVSRPLVTVITAIKNRSVKKNKM